MEKQTKIVAEKKADRLDKFLADNMPLSRSRIKNAITAGDVLINEKAAKPGEKIRIGDIITVRIGEPSEIQALPEDMPIDIVFEDEYIAVINKRQGMVVHPAPGNYTGTLVNALLFHLKDLSGINGQIRPGIVHRIDKDTSGLLVIAKNDEAHISLAEQIKSKNARRIYEAIVHGNIKQDELIIDKSIARSKKDRKKMAVDENGRNAVTKIRVLERFGEFTYIQAELETGRTHQIRVHLASIKRPVAADTVYGSKNPKLHSKGQLLHAKTLILRHPGTSEELEFNAPLPEYFERALCKLRAK